MSEEKKKITINTNGKITVCVYFPDKPRYSNSQDIQSEFKFDFGSDKENFQALLKEKLEDLEKRILIATGYKSLDDV